MTSLPVATTQASHRPESKDWLDAPEEDQPLDLREAILRLFPLTYSDPTGSKALRAIQKQVGYFEEDAEVHVRIKSKVRGLIDIRLDFELRSIIIEHLNQVGQITPTQSGSNFRARFRKQKKTPTAAEFGDKNSGEGPTQNNH